MQETRLEEGRKLNDVGENRTKLSETQKKFEIRRKGKENQTGKSNKNIPARYKLGHFDEKSIGEKVIFVLCCILIPKSSLHEFSYNKYVAKSRERGLYLLVCYDL